jgi:hypothetical protein
VSDLIKQAFFVVGAAVALAIAAPARAHVGGQVAVAHFRTPAQPTIVHGDVTDSVGPFAFASADQSYVVRWDDGDVDPTGKFVFYWLDHQPTSGLVTADIERLGTRLDDRVNFSSGYFVSCFCASDTGITCPPVVRDPATNCANQLVWDTSELPPGTYWLAAVNDDPPFHVYNVSAAPIRVGHGATPLPPAVIVVRPDSVGSWDKTYHVQWLAADAPLLTFDLAWGDENGDPQRPREWRLFLANQRE